MAAEDIRNEQGRSAARQDLDQPSSLRRSKPSVAPVLRSIQAAACTTGTLDTHQALSTWTPARTRPWMRSPRSRTVSSTSATSATSMPHDLGTGHDRTTSSSHLRRALPILPECPDRRTHRPQFRGVRDACLQHPDEHYPERRLRARITSTSTADWWHRTHKRHTWCCFLRFSQSITAENGTMTVPPQRSEDLQQPTPR
jgi:hypothetical protein